MSDPPKICPVCKKEYLEKWYHPKFPEVHYVHSFKDDYTLEIGYLKKAISCIQRLYTGQRINSEGVEVRPPNKGPNVATKEELEE